jgi:hypothetical protein
VRRCLFGYRAANVRNPAATSTVARRTDCFTATGSSAGMRK